MNGEVDNGDGDASLLRRLRAAEAALDERPSPQVRQAVMRAAAGTVGRASARPPSAFGRLLATARRLPPAWRWSAPVAASVLVGAIAVELVAEVHRAGEPVPAASERAPAASTGAAGAARPLQEPRESKPAAPAAAAAPAVVAPPPTAVQNAAQTAPAPRPRKSEAEALPAPQGTADSARMEAKPPAAQDAAAGRSTAVIAAPAPPSAPAAAEAAASQSSAAARARLAAPSAKQLAAPPASEPQSPQQWIERIIELRRAGRDQEADRELEQLRQRYPGFSVPPAALR